MLPQLQNVAQTIAAATASDVCTYPMACPAEVPPRGLQPQTLFPPFYLAASDCRGFMLNPMQQTVEAAIKYCQLTQAYTTADYFAEKLPAFSQCKVADMHSHRDVCSSLQHTKPCLILIDCDVTSLAPKKEVFLTDINVLGTVKEVFDKERTCSVEVTAIALAEYERLQLVRVLSEEHLHKVKRDWDALPTLNKKAILRQCLGISTDIAVYNSTDTRFWHEYSAEKMIVGMLINYFGEGYSRGSLNIDGWMGLVKTSCFERVHIFVETLNGETTTLHVTLCDTIRSVKTKIQARKGIPMHQQRLIFAHHPGCIFALKDHFILSHYDIQENSKLNVVLTTTMKIFIEELGGSALIPFDVLAADRVDDVKAKMSDLSGIPVPEQLLLLKNGTLMKDEQTLSDYNIKYGAVIYFFSRIPHVDLYMQWRGKFMETEEESD